MMNSFENNIKVEDAFNQLLDKDIWIKHEGKEAQHNIGDFYNVVLGKNFDFKIDCYDNDNNIVIEENQKYERMYEKNNCEDYLDKIRDTDIFDKYEFLNRE